MPTAELTEQNDIHTLYSKHHSWLQRWLQARLGCSQQAADFVQDTFVRILASRNAHHRVAGIREPRSFLTTIANRVLIDHYRRRALEKAYLKTLAERPESVDISPEQRLVILQTLQELDAMLRGLGEKVRRAFLLAQLEGLRYADIATRLDVSVSSVKKYMAKATEHCLLYALEAELNP